MKASKQRSRKIVNSSSVEQRRKVLTEELNRIISAAAEMGAEKVILFGSLAHGDVGTESDIDILIVKNTRKKFLDRLDEFYSKIQPRAAVDVLVYTPEELVELAETRRFVQKILAEGVVVYEKAAERGSSKVDGAGQKGPGGC